MSHTKGSWLESVKVGTPAYALVLMAACSGAKHAHIDKPNAGNMDGGQHATDAGGPDGSAHDAGKAPQPGDDAALHDSGMMVAPPLPSRLDFNSNWLFLAQDQADFAKPDFDDSSFERVSLPHANKYLTRHSGGTPPDLPTETQFVSWYRRHFSLPDVPEGTRVIVEFQGTTAESTVYVNGARMMVHRGAYTPFAIDISDVVQPGKADNVIALREDSRVQAGTPPEGGSVDYLLFGGIARDVTLSLRAPLHVEGAFYSAPRLSTGDSSVHSEIQVVNQADAVADYHALLEIRDQDQKLVASGTAQGKLGAKERGLLFVDSTAIADAKLWHPDAPYLYTASVALEVAGVRVDSTSQRIGLRTARFDKTDGHFYINDQKLELRGLDRHESFAFLGRAAPNRLQERDADILKYELGINIVRTSHYPQDPEFLSRCDEIGLLVLEEMPGWQHIGDDPWKQLAIHNTEDMVTRDRNHPSIVLWGVRINESGDDHDFYTATNARAHALDSTRQTGGIRNFKNSEFLEDVYTYNDFSGTIEAPTQMPWLVTENMGHTFPTASWDPETQLVEHMRRHASIHNDALKQTTVSGALSWCAFDYNTNNDFGYKNICYHGVSDIFRIPKFAAYFYQSQRDPTLYGPMVYVANYAIAGSSPNTVTIASNAEQVELFAAGVSQGKLAPNLYTELAHPLFEFTNVPAGELRAEASIAGQVVATHVRKVPGNATALKLVADDITLRADGSDVTRVLVSVVDENEQVLPHGDQLVTLGCTGAGTFLGENPIALEGGRAAFYVQSKDGEPGEITCTASAQALTSGEVKLSSEVSTAERVPLPEAGAAITSITNLALGKTVNSDSAQGANPASYGNDGDMTTRWCANDGNTGHSFTVDLAAEHELFGIEIAWEHSGNYGYRVELSSDGQSFSTALDQTAKPESFQRPYAALHGKARYVKITATTLEPGSWASFYELSIFGK